MGEAIGRIRAQGQGRRLEAPSCDKVLGHGRLPNNGEFIAQRADRIYLLLRHPLAIWRSQKETGWKFCSLKALADQLAVMRSLAEKVPSERLMVLSYYELTQEDARRQLFGQSIEGYTPNSKAGQAGWGDTGELIRSGTIRECSLADDVEKALPKVWMDLADPDFARAMAEFREILRLTGREELNIEWEEAEFFEADTLQIGEGGLAKGAVALSLSGLERLGELPCEEGAFGHLCSDELVHRCEPNTLLKYLLDLRRFLCKEATVRFSTIDFDFVARLFSGKEPAYEQWYWKAFLQKSGEACSAVLVANHLSRSWGHRYFYNRERLGELLAEAGFEQVREVSATEEDSGGKPLGLYAKERFLLEGKLGPLTEAKESASAEMQAAEGIHPVVVIPVHKTNLNRNEFFALNQIGKVLGSYELSLLCPESLDVQSYLEVIPQLAVTRMNDGHFENVLAYNRLRKNVALYKKFAGFSHILFYELDAFVFRDELEFWCQQKVDYIGAPWVYRTNQEGCLLSKGVGNSGFSLVHIDHTVRALEKLKLSSGRTTAAQRASLMKLDVDHPLVQTEMNVDIFFSFLAESDPDFKKADFEQGLAFSFELCPADLFEYRQKELPFGCHAWSRYDRDFWIPMMNSLGLEEESVSARIERRKPMSPGVKIAHLKENALIRVQQGES